MRGLALDIESYPIPNIQDMPIPGVKKMIKLV